MTADGTFGRVRPYPRHVNTFHSGKYFLYQSKQLLPLLPLHYKPCLRNLSNSRTQQTPWRPRACSSVNSLRNYPQAENRFLDMLSKTMCRSNHFQCQFRVVNSAIASHSTTTKKSAHIVESLRFVKWLYTRSPVNACTFVADSKNSTHNLFVLFLVDVTALGDVALDGPSLATRLVQHLTVFAHESSINHLTVQLLTVLMLMVLL